MAGWDAWIIWGADSVEHSALHHVSPICMKLPKTWQPKKKVWIAIPLQSLRWTLLCYHKKLARPLLQTSEDPKTIGAAVLSSRRLSVIPLLSSPFGQGSALTPVSRGSRWLQSQRKWARDTMCNSATCAIKVLMMHPYLPCDTSSVSPPLNRTRNTKNMPETSTKQSLVPRR